MTVSLARQASRAVAGLLLTAPLLVLAALPAAAVADGEEPGNALPLGTSLLVFVGIPLLIMVLTAVPIFAGASRRKSRYRPNEGWNQQPMWFAGPDDPEAAVSAADLKQPGRGGSSGSW